MTGSGSVSLAARGVKMFIFRQSSDCTGGQVCGGKLQFCGHPGASLNAWKGVVHGCGACGDAKRSGPTGGAAYGTPRNTR